MKRFADLCLVAIVWTAAFAWAASAQQPGVAAASQPAGGNAQQRPATQFPPLTRDQQSTAQLVEALYLNHFSEKVGLSDDQALKAIPLLQTYVRQQQMWAARRTNAQILLAQALDRQSSADEIQTQLENLDQTDMRLLNTQRNFFRDIDPQLTIQQRGKLRVFLKDVADQIRKMIMESMQSDAATPQRPATPATNSGPR